MLHKFGMADDSVCRLFGLLEHGKGRNIRVEWLALAALLPFGPAAELCIAPGGGCFPFRCDAPHKGANVNFVSTVRAFHAQTLTQQLVIMHEKNQSSPLPEFTALVLMTCLLTVAGAMWAHRSEQRALRERFKR